MALNSTLLANKIFNACKGKSISGKELRNFVTALSEGTIEGFKQQHKVITIDTGIFPEFPLKGTGKGVGITGMLPHTMLGIAIPLTKSKKIFGLKMTDFLAAIFKEVAIHFTTKPTINTKHSFVGMGVGVGKVTSVSSSALTSLIMAKLKAKKLDGEKLKDLVNAFSVAFATHITAVGFTAVVIVGVPLIISGLPVPGSGPGKGIAI